MYKLKKFSFFLSIIMILLSSCKNMDNIDSIYIGSVQIKNSQPNQDIIHYPYIDFIIEPFLKSFLESFNKKQDNMPSNTKIIPTLRNIENIDDNVYKSAIYNNKYIYLPYNFDYKSLNETSRKQILKIARSNYWLSLDLKTSLWQQRIWGNISVYSSNSKLYSKRINITSHYFIHDKNSPYISPLDKTLNLQNIHSYQEEIKNLYKDLGHLLALKMKKKFLDIVKLKKYKENKKELRIFYKNERETIVKLNDKTKKNNP